MNSSMFELTFMTSLSLRSFSQTTLLIIMATLNIQAKVMNNGIVPPIYRTNLNTKQHQSIGITYLMSGQSATQPFLVSSRNAPPHNDNDVTTLKTAVQQTNVWDEEGTGAPIDTFQAIQSTFRSLEMYSKRRYKICIFSVILGRLREAITQCKGDSHISALQMGLYYRGRDYCMKIVIFGTK